MTTPIVDQAPSPLLDARQVLAAAIVAATGYTCHDSFTATFATPCYVLEPGGWKVSRTGIVTYLVNVTCLYANQSGQVHGGVEELARLAAIACVDAGWAFFEVPAPGVVTVGDRDYAAVQFQAEIDVTLRSI